MVSIPTRIRIYSRIKDVKRKPFAVGNNTNPFLSGKIEWNALHKEVENPLCLEFSENLSILQFELGRQAGVIGAAILTN